MPYNVIILTSTVIALAFGNVFNLLVRRFVGAEEVERYSALSGVRERVRGLRERVRERLGLGLGRRSEEETTTTTTKVEREGK